MTSKRVVSVLAVGAVIVATSAGVLLADVPKRIEEVMGPRKIHTVIPETPKLPAQVRAVLARPVPLDDQLPAPAIVNGSTQAHMITAKTSDVATIEATLRPIASQWNDPGVFQINSVWQVTPDITIATGFFDGVLLPGLVTLPSKGTPRFVPLPAIGGGGPATIHGVKDSWVLIQTGLSYVVYNYQTGAVDVSDQNATPGNRTQLK